jgi:hypothetical protein
LRVLAPAKELLPQAPPKAFPQFNKQTKYILSVLKWQPRLFPQSFVRAIQLSKVRDLEFCLGKGHDG